MKKFLEPPATAPATGTADARHWLPRIRDGAAVLLGVVALVSNFLAYRDYIFEDTFITYRYAENIALGHGFVFNLGERVLGASAPLYTLLLALLHRLGLELPVAGGLCTVVFLSGIALCGAWLLRRQGFANLAVIYAIVVLWGSGGVLHFWGMETTLLSFIVLTAVAAALAGHLVLSGVLTGLACITRFDGAVFAVTILGLLWLRDRRPPWRVGLLAAAVTTPWFVFSGLYFGSLLPNTLGAKAQDTAMLDYMWGSIRILALRFFTPILRFVAAGDVPPTTFFLALFVLLVLPVPLRLAALWRREPLLLALLVYPVGLWLGYSLIGPPIEHSWYLVPALYSLVVYALLAWGTLFDRSPTRSLPSVVTALLAIASLLLLPAGVEREAQALMRNDAYQHRVGAYATIAAWLKSHGLDDLKLFTLEPGYLTFISKNPVVDGAGLVTKGIYFHGPEERRTSFAELMREHAPELLIVPDIRLSQNRAPKEFAPVYRTTVNSVVMRRDVLDRHLEVLSRDWLRQDYPHPGPVELGHPFAFDFESGRQLGWWGAPRFVGHPFELLRRRGPVEGAYLTTDEGVSGTRTDTIESPPFRIDFDELRFWFFGTGGAETAAELLVNGQVLLRVDGASPPGGPVEVRWSVYPWRGQVGVLRFVDRDEGEGTLAADAVRSIRHRRFRSLDDFESGRFGDTWQHTFGEAPTPSQRIARHLGPGFIRGRFSAVGLWMSGRQVLQSRPFVITHDELAFTVFDFGGHHRTRIELLVDDEPVRAWRGLFSQRLIGVIWPLAELRGRQAVLRVLDETDEPDMGIGIDDIRLFDPLDVD